MMNDWIKRAGCTDTTFLNCHGLGSTEQRTTARDLARIVEEATKNADFRELFGANSYKVPATNKTEASRDLKALNYLKEETYMPNLVYKGVTGGIAHYSEVSGASLVCTAEKNNMSYTVVVLGCTRTFKSNGWSVETYGNYEEAWDLLDFAFDNYKHCRLLHEGQSLYQFSVANGENQVVAQCTTAMDAILPVNARMKNLLYKYSVKNGGLTAPIAKDEVIATLQIWYQNSCIAETELHAMSSVRSTADQNLRLKGGGLGGGTDLKGILAFVGIVFLVIFVPFVIYLIINNLRRSMARNRRRRRRQSRRRSR
jgi:D-alanyl-D-alanine carboxypeptidase